MIRITSIVAGVLLLGLCRSQDPNLDCQCVAYSFCNDSDIVTANTNNCDSLQEVCCKVSKGASEEPKIPFQGNFICGKRAETVLDLYYKGKPSDDVDKITLGDDTDTFHGEYPWMVAIMKLDGDNRSFLCGGSIIYPNVILTAAHSVSGLAVSQLMVLAGVWNTSSLVEEHHQSIPVSKIIIHNNFNKRKAENDFALLILNESLVSSDHVGPVCLPSPTLPYNQTKCVATGWGAEDFGSGVQSVLKQVTLSLIDSTTCEAQLQKVPRLGSKFKLHSSSICAGGAQADTCKGDGGGPLMCPTVADPGQYVQVGITSWGIQCGQGGSPGVYASVSAADDWIEEQVKLLEDSHFPLDIKQKG